MKILAGVAAGYAAAFVIERSRQWKREQELFVRHNRSMANLAHAISDPKA